MRILFTLLACLYFLHAQAQLPPIEEPIIAIPTVDRYIATDGSDDNDGSLGSPMATFQKALNSIPFSDTSDVYAVIYFKAGNYYPKQGLQQSYEQYKQGAYTKNVSIKGIGSVRIYGDSTSAGTSLIWLRGSNISIENLYLYNARNSGIYLRNNVGTTENWMRHVLVKNIQVDGTVSHGVISRFVENLKYEFVKVTNGQQENLGTTSSCQWGSALRAELSKNVIIYKCETYHNKGEGINLASSINGIIEGCVSYDNFAPNFYLIRDQKVVFKNNLSYNIDSTYWRGCKPGGGGLVERVPTAGLSIANEVGYDDFPFGYVCEASRNHGSGFVNNISDSLFIYNNIFMMAPLYIIDESFGDFLCINVHANNFSNIHIEYNTLLGQVDPRLTDYQNAQPLISMVFDPTYFRCIGEGGKSAYRIKDVTFHSNILTHADSVNGNKVDVVRVLYGGRPCNGGSLGSKFSSSYNLWSKYPDEIVDHYISSFEMVPNFLHSAGTDYESNPRIFHEPYKIYGDPNNLSNIVPLTFLGGGANDLYYKGEYYKEYLQYDYWYQNRETDRAAGALKSQHDISSPALPGANALYYLYPNPTGGKVFIKSNDAIQPSISLQLYDAVGRAIETFYSLQEMYIEMDVQHLQDGVYFLTISSNQGQERLKIIKRGKD